MNGLGAWLDRNRHMVFIALLLTALAGAGIFYFQQPAQQDPIEVLPPEPTATATSTPAPSPTPGLVRIYITGAVVNSDVFELPRGSIIKDAVDAAGGFAPDADKEQINLARELQDQQQIHVPRQGEENPPPLVQGGSESGNKPGEMASTTGEQRLNLNTASLEQLDDLPGIGPAIGQRIIEYRESNGGFKSIEEITAVSGIGEATFAKIKALIKVE